jgi:2-hydroxychromene-2-carboxylate isomerase
MSASSAEFFFDPICPWAWITSRWVEEVRRHRPVDVEWRFIALRMVNEGRDMPAEYLAMQDVGLRLLRIGAALREAEGPEAIGPYYSAIGGAIHVDKRRDDLADPAAVAPLLSEIGYDPALVSAATDEAFDKVVREDTEAALGRCGRDVGTPILTFAPPDGPSFFGPVISRVPRGAEAVELWESVERIAVFPGFAELKRSLREPPQVER